MKLKKIVLFILTTAVLFGIMPKMYAEDKSEILYNDEINIMQGLGYFELSDDLNANTILSGTQVAMFLNRATGRNIEDLYQGVTSIQELKTIDLYKIFIDLAGYKQSAEAYGGYPFGYSKLVGELKLNKQINLDAAEPITLGAFSKILENAMKVKVMETRYSADWNPTYTKSDECFDEVVLKVNKINGQVTAWDNDGFSGAAGEDCIVINDTQYSYSGFHAEDYYGHFVVAYSKIDDTDDDTVVYMCDDDNQTIVINAKDFESFENKKLSWIEDGRVISKGIEATAYVIKNGSLISTYSNDIFDISNGSITIIRDDEGKYSTVIIEDYYDFVISLINKDTMKLYNEINLTYDTISFDYSDDNETSIIIQNSIGEDISFNNLAAGDVLSISQGKNRTRIKVCTDRVKKYTVNGISKDEDEYILHGDGDDYKLGQTWLKYNNYETPKIGEILTMYLNTFGEVAYITSTTSSQLAYIIRCSEDESDEEVYFKLLNQDGTVVTKKCAQKIRYTSSEGSEKLLKNHNLYSLFHNYTGVVEYETDSSDNIKKISVPFDERPKNNANVLYKTYANSTALYKQWAKFFQGEVFVNASTYIFVVPTNKDDITGYMVIGVTDLVNDKKYDMKAYAYGENNLLAKCVVINGDILEKRTAYMVVSNVQEVVDKSDDIVIQVQGYLNGTETKLMTERTQDNPFDNANTIFDATSKYKIENGDIIRCVINPKNGYVSLVDVLFKANQVNPSFINGQKGNIAGSLGNAPQEGNKGNPALKQGTYNAVPDYATSGDRYLYGWVSKKFGNYIEVTNQDLSVESYVESDKYCIERYATNIFTASMTVDYSGKIITANSGATIRSYSEVGADCSRVLVLTKSQGDPVQLIVLNK